MASLGNILGAMPIFRPIAVSRWLMFVPLDFKPHSTTHALIYKDFWSNLKTLRTADVGPGKPMFWEGTLSTSFSCEYDHRLGVCYLMLWVIFHCHASQISIPADLFSREDMPKNRPHHLMAETVVYFLYELSIANNSNDGDIRVWQKFVASLYRWSFNILYIYIYIYIYKYIQYHI